MKDKKSIRAIIYFSAVCFIYTTTMSMLNRDIAGSIEGQHLFLYMIQSLALAVGMILYPLFVQTIKISGRAANVLNITSCVLYIVGILSLRYNNNYTYVLVMMILIPMSMGYSQGISYVRFALELHDKGTMGRSLGLSLGISILLQYFLQIRSNTGIFLLLIMCGLQAGLVVFELQPGRENDKPVPAKGQNHGFFHMIAIAGCLIMLANYLDGQISLLLDTTDFFSWPRLLYGIGFIAMGFLCDMKRTEIPPITMLISAVVAILMPALLTDVDFHTFDICFFYFYLGLCVVYNTFRLMRYSAAGQNMYAAVAYRAIDNFLTGLLVLVGFSKLPQLTALIINTVLLAVTVLLVWKEGARVRNVSGVAVSGEDRKNAFADKYRLTDREKEVLDLLITKDEKGDDMAKELGVSRRGFVSLTSSIYRKTDTGSRVALLQKYMSE